MDAAVTTTLIENAAKKSGLVWVRAASSKRAAQPVWHTWHDGAVYVLTGGLEQPVPGGLDELGGVESARAVVTARGKDKAGRLVTFETTVARVAAGSEEWETLVPALQAKRLNLPDGETAPQRWARECTLWRLRPTGDVIDPSD